MRKTALLVLALVAAGTARGQDDLAAALARGKALAQGGRYAEAAALYEDALAWLEEAHGPDHPDVAACHYNLAGLYLAQSRHAAAEEHYRRALGTWEATLGPAHPHTRVAREELAALLALESRIGEAAALYRRQLAVVEEIGGANTPALLPGLLALAELESAQGHLGEADALYERALAVLGDAGAPLDRAAVLAHLALLDGWLGRHEVSEARYREALDLYDRHAPDHPDHAATLNNLAMALVTARRDDDAEPLLRRALQVGEAAYGADDLALVPTLANLAALYDRQGRSAESLALTRRAVAMLGPQLELIASRPPGELGPHESLWRDVAALHQANLEWASSSPPPPPPPTTPVPAEGYWAQLGSRPSLGEAEADFERLGRLYAELLDGLPHRVQDADLGERGVWHRMQVGPFAERAAAQELCRQLAARGHDECLVMHSP